RAVALPLLRARGRPVGDRRPRARPEPRAGGQARTRIAGEAQVAVGAGGIDGNDARERRLDAAEVLDAVRAVQRSEVDRLERVGNREVDEIRYAGRLHSRALLPALLVRDDRIEVERHTVIRRPLQGAGEVHRFILEVVVILDEELDRQEVERLGAGNTAVRPDEVVAVDPRAKSGNVLFGVARAEDEPEIAGTGGPVVTPGTRQPGCHAVGRKTAVLALHPHVCQPFGELKGAYRRQVDRAAHGTFDRFGFRGLDHFDTGDDGGSKVFEIDAAAPGPRSHGGNTLDLGTGRVGSPDLDAGPDTCRASNLDARDVLENLGQVLVGQLADVLREDDFDQVVRESLLFERV